MDKKIKTVLSAALLMMSLLAPRLAGAQGMGMGMVRADLKTEFLGRLGLKPSEPKPTAGKAAFNRLTNAAGMLMGRVDVATIGAWRVKLVLDLR